jgi:rubrerythrin
MGAVGTTADNLKAAAEGERYETVDMYPQFAEIAEAEGYPEIAFYLRSVGRFENEHRKEYEDALEELES